MPDSFLLELHCFISTRGLVNFKDQTMVKILNLRKRN